MDWRGTWLFASWGLGIVYGFECELASTRVGAHYLELFSCLSLTKLRRVFVDLQMFALSPCYLLGGGYGSVHGFKQVT